jgi:hypothetical protein
MLLRFNPVLQRERPCAHAAAVVFVRNGGGSRATLLPCPCAVTSRHTLNPVGEIMSDRCTPEYERVIAKMGSLLPYARARTLLPELLKLSSGVQGGHPAVSARAQGGCNSPGAPPTRAGWTGASADDDVVGPNRRPCRGTAHERRSSKTPDKRRQV